MSSLRLSPADKSRDGTQVLQMITESLQVYLLLLTESFVNPPGILAFLFFKFVLKHKDGNFYCP